MVVNFSTSGSYKKKKSVGAKKLERVGMINKHIILHDLNSVVGCAHDNLNINFAEWPHLHTCIYMHSSCKSMYK